MVDPRLVDGQRGKLNLSCQPRVNPIGEIDNRKPSVTITPLTGGNGGDSGVTGTARDQRRAVVIRILSIMILGTACAAPLLVWFIVEKVVGPA